MQALSIELADETVDALEAERELFGFESRQAYVRWIIDNRGSIEAERGPGSDRERGRARNRLLTDHSERIARLEKRVTALSRALEQRGVDAGSTDENGTRGADDPRTEGDDDRSTDGRDARRTDEAAVGGNGEPSAGRDERSAGAEARREPVLEVRGSPRTVRQGPDAGRRSEAGPSGGGGGDGEDANECEDGTAGDDSGSDAPTGGDSTAEDSAALTPERVARIPEDPVHEDAGVLGTVETERLDELTRRAVASTRERLNRDVETGLEYTSSTRLAGDGVRPGEDVTDLDALSIPGRSTETVEKRRHAVGRALAYLRDEGRARRSDFVDALYAECPAGYETADGWWRCIKGGLKQVDAVEGGEGTRVWQYRG